MDAQNAFGCIDDLQPLKDALLREFGFTWGMVATFTDAEFAAGSSTEKKRYLGLAMYKICWRLRKGCCIPWCTRDTASNLDLPAAAGSGTHQDHDEDLEAIYGTKIDDPSQLVYDIELMVDEIFDKCYQICAHHHDQRTTRKYTQSVTTLQNEVRFVITVAFKKVFHDKSLTCLLICSSSTRPILVIATFLGEILR